jgi:uncharacterized protein
MRGLLARLIAVLSLLVGLAPGAAAIEVPYLTGRVNDYAGVIPAETRERIERRLEAYEKETTVQIAVLTVGSLDGEALEDYSMKVAETWKLGRKGKDNGVLLLVAQRDRKMRLEVGYGLEATLPDALCRRILDGVVRPRFRAGDYGGGVESGVDAVIAALGGKGIAAPPSGPMAFAPGIPWYARVAGLGLFAAVIGVFSLVAILGPGFTGWFLYLFLVPFYAAFPSVLIHPIAGAILTVAWLVGLPIARILLHRSDAGRNLPARHSGWVALAALGGRGHGGGGFGGSPGFSGGGGSFGGGGASSGW